MSKLLIEDMMSGKRSKYSLVMAVAKRAREIALEAEEQGIILEEKCVNLAIKDFYSERYEIYEPSEVNNSEVNKC